MRMPFTGDDRNENRSPKQQHFCRVSISIRRETHRVNADAKLLVNRLRTEHPGLPLPRSPILSARWQTPPHAPTNRPGIWPSVPKCSDSNPNDYVCILPNTGVEADDVT